MSKITNWSRKQEQEGEQADGETIHYFWKHDITDDFVFIASRSARNANLDKDLYQTRVYTHFDIPGASVDERDYELKVDKESRRPGYEERRFNRSQAVDKIREKVVKWLKKNPNPREDEETQMEMMQ